MLAAFFIGKEFLNRGEDHAAAGDIQKFAQVFPAFRLNWYLPQQLLTKRERVEKLVVQIVAVGEHDDGGILHRRVLHDFSGVEHHRKTFAAPLRVPDDARPSVALTFYRSSRGNEALTSRSGIRMSLLTSAATR